jgi:glycosyltransferase involved in cell wall biosynthesis
MLAWCDSPLSITGFGVVAKNILGRIYKTGMFDLACVGINHFEEHFDKAFEDRTEVPYKVFIGQDVMRQGSQTVTYDPMGRAKTIQMLKKGNVDIFYCMRDLWDMVYQNAQGRPHLESYLPLHIQLAKENGANFRVLSHFPLEYQVQPNWKPALEMMDYGYCFTAGGMPQMEPYADKIAWAPQGCDTEIFKPLRNFNKDAFKQARMGLDPNTFVVLCVQRNQPRKDIPATIEAFAKFKGMVGTVEGKRPVLWLHMRPDDNFGDARQWVKDNGLQVDYDVCFPPNFNVGAGWSEAELNMLYNTADVFVSTSVAEGFGLTPVEAGCAGIPVLVAGHTGHLQTISQLGMPYVACKPMEKREKVAPSPITPTDTDDMAAKLAAHYADPTTILRRLTGWSRRTSSNSGRPSAGIISSTSTGCQSSRLSRKISLGPRLARRRTPSGSSSCVRRRPATSPRAPHLPSYPSRRSTQTRRSTSCAKRSSVRF